MRGVIIESDPHLNFELRIFRRLQTSARRQRKHFPMPSYQPGAAGDGGLRAHDCVRTESMIQLDEVFSGCPAAERRQSCSFGKHGNSNRVESCSPQREEDRSSKECVGASQMSRQRSANKQGRHLIPSPLLRLQDITRRSRTKHRLRHRDVRSDLH
jgi:hypothetical protein